ncbi:hypothetical protein XENOCAPTIV_030110 [Xenoophorus captivus]|uniref:Uncharacterized protein n=1 Tax=Xenoophorus captivus TaxID=1517983 RepID=A0ABV0Q4T1_9TELE
MQRRERFTERKKLHQLKRDHEQQKGSKRKVLRLDEGQDGELSSGSDTEDKGRGRKDKEGQGQDVDIQSSRRLSAAVRTCPRDTKPCSSCCSAEDSTLSWLFPMSITPPGKTRNRSDFLLHQQRGT